MCSSVRYIVSSTRSTQRRNESKVLANWQQDDADSDRVLCEHDLELCTVARLDHEKVRCGGSLTWVPSFKFGPSMSPRGIEVYCLSIPLVSGSCEGSRGSPPVGVERSTPPRANRGARWQGCAQLACS
jgi:hypothetical protein